MDDAQLYDLLLTPPDEAVEAVAEVIAMGPLSGHSLDWQAFYRSRARRALGAFLSVALGEDAANTAQISRADEREKFIVALIGRSFAVANGLSQMSDDLRLSQGRRDSLWDWSQDLRHASNDLARHMMGKRQLERGPVQPLPTPPIAPDSPS